MRGGEEGMEGGRQKGSIEKWMREEEKKVAGRLEEVQFAMVLGRWTRDGRLGQRA